MQTTTRRYTDRTRELFTAGAVLTVLALVFGVAGCGDKTLPLPAPSPVTSIDLAPSWAPSAPALPDDVRVAWAYLDSTDGSSRRGGDDDPRPLDNLVVPGVAQDYLNTLSKRSSTLHPDEAAVMAAALAQDTAAGERLIELAGGLDASLERITAACSLDGWKLSPPAATATDVARYAACLREGAISDSANAAAVLHRMRATAGGIGDVRGNDGGQRLAQFNSTADADAGAGRTRTGCLAVGAYWSAAVLVDFPTERGAMFGVAACAEVARGQFPPDTQQAPESIPPAPAVSAS
jgi:hypothetical protein